MWNHLDYIFSYRTEVWDLSVVYLSRFVVLKTIKLS